MRPTPLRALIAKSKMGFRQKSVSQRVVRGAAIDSRLVKPGDLFFALVGKRTDGHAHLAQAACAGAVAAVVHSDYCGDAHGMELLRVADVTESLQQLAASLRAEYKGTVIEVTGSLGKTTTKEFAKVLIGSSYRLFASPLSYNSQVTVPLNVLSATGDEEIWLLEMGMSEPGQLQKLVNRVPPDIALLTTVAAQHADAFPDGLEGIAREKSEIFSHAHTRLGFFDAGSPYAAQFTACGACRKKTFSMVSPQADFFAQRRGGLLSIVEKGEDVYEVPLTLPMDVYDHNFLAAWSLARALEIPCSVLKEMAPLIRLPPMRFERVEKGGIIFINDAYNAIPETTQAALRHLPQGAKKIAVLSEMNALGVYSEQGHRAVATAALESVDVLLCLGERCRWMEEVWQRAQKPCRRFETRDALAAHLKSIVAAGDVVLLKGARTYALDQILHEF